MIGMPVADQNHFDLRRVEAELRESRQQVRLDLVGAQRVDHHQTRRRLDHVGDRADVADGVHVVEDLRGLNDRIVRSIRARRLTPEVHGVGPARANRRLEPIELLDDGWGIRLRWCWRLALLRGQANRRGAHQHDDCAACRHHHRGLPVIAE
jgi:hypothetical protein